VNETELYENGSPISPSCAGSRRFDAVNRHIEAALREALALATLHADSAYIEFAAISSDVPSSLPPPDGVQRIHNASHKLTQAREELMTLTRG